MVLRKVRYGTHGQRTVGTRALPKPSPGRILPKLRPSLLPRPAVPR